MSKKSTARNAALDEAGAECERVYSEHRRSKSYPFDMGGLALECAEQIRAHGEEDMITRPSRGGFVTYIPVPENPDVAVWAHTEQDAEYLAAKEHMPLAIQQEEERVRMELEFTIQALAEFRTIRARA